MILKEGFISIFVNYGLVLWFELKVFFTFIRNTIVL
ncbi:hypothetical protein OKW21_005706 [Catalinimonas alkaloidigena]|nr:hypothetical protein [Catalinimonas alkaloidigena]